MFQDDGASTEVTGTLASSMARITAGNGSRTSPEKLKPAIDKYTVAVPHTILRRRTKNGIDDVVGGLDGCWKVLHERHLEVF